MLHSMTGAPREDACSLQVTQIITSPCSSIHAIAVCAREVELGAGILCL